MNLPEAPNKWCFIFYLLSMSSTQQCRERSYGTIWQNWCCVMGIPHPWIPACISFLLQGSLPGCFLSGLWEGDSSALHSSHFLRNPTEPKAEWAMACARFILWNNCTQNVLYIAAKQKGRTWRLTEVKKSSFHFPRFCFKFYMQGALVFFFLYHSQSLNYRGNYYLQS